MNTVSGRKIKAHEKTERTLTCYSCRYCYYFRSEWFGESGLEATRKIQHQYIELEQNMYYHGYAHFLRYMTI